MTNSPASPPSWLKIFRLGQHYMKTWPTDKRLIAVFPENRIAHATRFALRAAPPLAAFTLAWQIAFAAGKDEFFCIIEGRIRITDHNGIAAEFGPGEAGVIPSGFTGSFEVLAPVRKYYVVMEPVA